LAEAALPLVAWIGPWVAFVVVAENHQSHLTRDRVAAALFIAANVRVFFGVLLKRGTNAIAQSHLFASFLLTLGSLVGTCAFADLVTARAFPGCYVEAGVSHFVLGKTDAIYYALSTLTTVGFGDITAHTTTCRSLTIIELAIGFPVLGLAVAAVAARLFES
jgi:hypothetical protein